ncbi:hypothetical protein COLU111180_12975 [Cohnella lubricantis]|uniref:Uncharacterized protein n=1 Tax=Cohnella lubricantis TaxID=2163172 RepID=A0A841TG96_9BACL|nr:hypothetical protein [Cohnella lubricantis]MBB6679386.1 hypothetical protein [Cohnella lubricantis]MBP2117468.1 DNA-binding NarL/FixJ family response regulator [Cohnella lubricantis]
MEPWHTLVIIGAAIAGYGWLLPKPKQGEAGEAAALQSDEAYDRLLEDLEAENRELVDAVASFKKEQDDTVRRLGLRIRELETQMVEWRAQGQASESQQSATSAASTDSAVSAEPHGPAALSSSASASDLASVPDLEAKPHLAAEEADLHNLVPQSIHARYAELLDLHSRGRSVEQIAKTLGLNKGEVQLILQLAKREEEQHA